MIHKTISYDHEPDHEILRKELEDLFKDQYTIRLCYEACYISYTLCRFLRKNGVHCDVIAPSLISVKTGARVKTGRLVAAKLAEYYAKKNPLPRISPQLHSFSAIGRY